MIIWTIITNYTNIKVNKTTERIEKLERVNYRSNARIGVCNVHRLVLCMS